MKNTQVTYKLTRPARKKGGDRYEPEGGVITPVDVLYVNQTYSRPHGELLEMFDVTFHWSMEEELE